ASPNVVIYIIGNKIDMINERKIKTDDGQKLANEFNLCFFESSAKSGENINEIFDSLVNKIDDVYSKIEVTGGNKIFNANKKRSRCCS
ncbi:MAG: hypothetical protein HUJ62_06505, partial [Streptococcus gallolyticus]|nr:hypothetical protein [Streptococcus gallolyticus]